MDRGAITFAAAGDVQLGDSAICPGFGVASRWGPEDADRLLEGLGRRLAADLSIINLETVLSSAGLNEDDWASMQMRGHRRYAAALARAGVTVAGVANNHAFQHGPDAFGETVSALEEAGIAVCGIAGEGPWRARPARLDVRGRSVGVLAYSMRPRQYSSDVPPYAEGREPDILADVRRLREQTDHVAVSLHWGEEFVDRPSGAEVALGRALVHAGASLVVGHHPHVLRPVERFERGVIAYSLGNLVSDMVWYEPLRRGAILTGELRPEGVATLALSRTWIADDLAPRVVEEEPDPAVADLEGLEPTSYARAVSETVGTQRRHAYRYALRNLHRYPTRLLLQLARRTARNKLAALAGRS